MGLYGESLLRILRRHPAARSVPGQPGLPLGHKRHQQDRIVRRRVRHEHGRELVQGRERLRVERIDRNLLRAVQHFCHLECVHQEPELLVVESHVRTNVHTRLRDAAALLGAVTLHVGHRAGNLQDDMRLACDVW